jgi:hypothetical protein
VLILLIRATSGSEIRFAVDLISKPDCIHTYSGLNHMYRRMWYEMTTPFFKLSVYVFIFNKISLLSHLFFLNLTCSCPYSYNLMLMAIDMKIVSNPLSRLVIGTSRTVGSAKKFVRISSGFGGGEFTKTLRKVCTYQKLKCSFLLLEYCKIREC